MVQSAEVAAELARVARDPEEFVTRLTVEDETNALRPLYPLWPEQQDWLHALMRSRFVFAVKPRQVGFTTISLAFLMWKSLFAKHGRRVLTMVHDPDALKRTAKMIEVYHDNLPMQIRPGYDTKNETSTVLNKRSRDGRKIPGASFNRLLAGGRGQARSWTYNDLHATEMSKWASGTSAHNKKEELPADQAAFSSAMNTIHDSDGSCIVESTGNGPRGLFYDLYEEAILPGSRWDFVFLPWTSVPRYRDLEISDAGLRAIEAELDAEESRLIRQYGVDLRQLAWRRTKMKTLQMSPLAFRRDFPLTHAEPFLLDQHGWFPQEALLAQLQFAPRDTMGIAASAATYRQFLPFEPNRRYVIGMDTSGGTGGDESVIQVLRDDLVHAAIWATNRASVGEQAMMVNRISGSYGRCPAIIEANNHGVDVIQRAELLGTNLWKDDEDEDFWSTGGRAGNSKRLAMVHIREVISAEHCIINDAHTIQQAQKVVEKVNGKVEAHGGKDDRIYAFALALWAARDLWGSTIGPSATLDSERDRQRRIRRLAEGVRGWTG